MRKILLGVLMLLLLRLWLSGSAWAQSLPWPSPSVSPEPALPSISHRWNGAAYVEAATILAARSEQNWSRLPRIGQKDSDALFARMVSDQNLALYRDAATPIAARIDQATQSMNAVGDILQLYVRAFQDHVDVGREVLALRDLTLRLSEVTLSCMDEMLLDLDTADPQYPARINGIDALRRNLAVQATGAIELLAAPADFGVGYRERDLTQFAKQLTATLPSLVTRLPLPTQSELVEHLQHQLDVTHGSYQKALRKLADAVSRQVAGAEATPVATTKGKSKR